MYNDDYYQFACRPLDAIKIKELHPNIIYQYSVGLFHFIHLYLFKKHRLIGFIFGVCCFIYLQSLTYGCIIQSVYPSLNQRLYQYCEHLNITSVRHVLNESEISQLKQQIKNEFHDEIDYFDIYLEGKFYKITYTKKILPEKIEHNFSNYIASEDGVVDLIDIKSGNVLVQRGQYVSKGEVIVSNQIVTTNDEIVSIEVEGKVYAYVYHTLEASMLGELNPDTFTHLYQNIHLQIKKILNDDGYIVDENVLQYTSKEGKIILKVQFTLYQNIAQKEFINE